MAIPYPLSYKPFYDKLSRLTGMSNEEIDIFILRMTKVLVNDLNYEGRACLPYLGKFTLKRMSPRKRAFTHLVTKKKTIINVPAQDKLRFKVNRKFSKLFL